MFLWRTDENHPSIIMKYPPYLFICWRLTCSHNSEPKASFLMTWLNYNCGASSEFVSSSIPSWQSLTVHAQPFRGARDLVFCLKVPLDSLLVWASRGGSGETARMGGLAWTFAARICDKYQIHLTRPNWSSRQHYGKHSKKLRPRWLSNAWQSTCLLTFPIL